MFFEKLGKFFYMTKLSNRNPFSPAVKPNGLYTLPTYMGNTNLFVSSCFLCTSVPSSLSLCLSLALHSFVCFPIVLPSLLVLRSCLLCLCFLCLCVSLSTLLFVSRSSFFAYKSFARFTSFACVSLSSFLIVQGFVFRKVSRAHTFFWFFTDR
jgi:hypothetical protein